MSTRASAPASPAAARWLRRAGVAAVVAVLTYVTARLLELDPEPVRVVLLALLLVAGVGLVGDALPRTSQPWYDAPTHPPLHRGRDQLTQTYVRLLEDHQASRHPDPAVRDRLAMLADQVLVARHGVHVHTERARELLGPEATAVLQGPVVRLGPRRLERLMQQIEEL